VPITLLIFDNTKMNKKDKIIAFLIHYFEADEADSERVK
jgi:hypothetical protein